MLASLVLLAPLALTPALQAEDSSQPKAETTQPKARTTVLHLEDGRVLRMKARELDGGWEVFTRGEWTRLPEGSVRRAKNEHELLAQAAKLERALPRGDSVRRVAYADWLVGEGLQIEALQELDRVLAQDPDQADALALLARADLPLALPHAPADEAGLETFFAAAARLEGAARELAVGALGAAPEIPGLRAALGRELLARTTGRRSLATLALRRLFPGSEAEGLVSRAVLDSSAAVRSSAALSLRAFEDPAVIVPAVRAMGSQHAEVRVNAIEALATMNYPAAVAPLYHRLVALQAGGGGSGYAPHVHIFNGRQRSYVQDFDVEVAQGAAVADPIINILIEGSVLDVAVIGVNEYVVANERAAVRRALAKLTGANPGDTTVAWERWWKEHGDEWQAGESPQKAPTTPAGQG
jgi:hypothetical protein